jgi:hypothetical protein
MSNSQFARDCESESDDPPSCPAFALALSRPSTFPLSEAKDVDARRKAGHDGAATAMARGDRHGRACPGHPRSSYATGASPRSRHARCVRVVARSSLKMTQREQGMPGASRTRSLACKMKKHTSVVTTGSAGTSRHSPRGGFTVSFALSPVSMTSESPSPAGDHLQA